MWKRVFLKIYATFKIGLKMLAKIIYFDIII